MADVTDAGVLTTASDLLFSGGREGYFFALDARNGSLLWKTVVGGRVRVGSDDLYGQRPPVRGRVCGQFAVRLRAAAISAAQGSKPTRFSSAMKRGSDRISSNACAYLMNVICPSFASADFSR